MKKFLFAAVVIRACGLVMTFAAAGNLFAAMIWTGDTPYLRIAAAFGVGAFIAMIFPNELASWAVNASKGRCLECGLPIRQGATGPCRRCGAATEPAPPPSSEQSHATTRPAERT